MRHAGLLLWDLISSGGGSPPPGIVGRMERRAESDRPSPRCGPRWARGAGSGRRGRRLLPAPSGPRAPGPARALERRRQRRWGQQGPARAPQGRGLPGHAGPRGRSAARKLAAPAGSCVLAPPPPATCLPASPARVRTIPAVGHLHLNVSEGVGGAGSAGLGAQGLGWSRRRKRQIIETKWPC
ncbi:PREDICTED: collagen alpha-1(I) chain-like [Chinchilla lanigera]|uniref:collagen alpha-1(I) chain-like n=1 Tax=Chinchilla lanigera TaxID=34839 RepID=UPI00038EBB86|nr:PREDICTED: collagen alpha-1(I) chain-like [Chinchilla lanigera]